MSGFSSQLGINLRLHFRNKMALLYGYLFPTIFLIAFWVLYRHESVPLARHFGELLTVTVLGGACFGLPTTLVSERERGVWRRYRLTPIATSHLVAGTLVARYFLLVVAALLQLVLAMAIGMPLPRHPLALWIAFTCVAFAFLGLGLVIAMTADNVPAVQALGQCIFLPMLIIGGVAVPLAALPEWAQHLSAFFPGRYAVDALQSSVTGQGLQSARFSILALLLIGLAGCVAGANMFRWDAQQRFAALRHKGWVAVALIGWIAVGVVAESRGHIAILRPAIEEQKVRTETTAPPARPGEAPSPTPPVPAPGPAVDDAVSNQPASPARSDSRAPAEKTPDPAPAPSESPARALPPVPSLPAGAPPAPPTEVPTTATAPGLDSWRAVTVEQIDRDIDFRRLPADAGVVSPIASAEEEPDEEVFEQLDRVRALLPAWAPGQVSDPVQRVRNVLYVAAVPDVYQMEPLERHLPHVVFERLQADVPKDQLIQILYWIALHPHEGDDTAVDYLRDAGLQISGPSDIVQARERVAFYAVKLLGRLLGRIVPR